MQEQNIATVILCLYFSVDNHIVCQTGNFVHQFNGQFFINHLRSRRQSLVVLNPELNLSTLSIGKSHAILRHLRKIRGLSSNSPY